MPVSMSSEPGDRSRVKENSSLRESHIPTQGKAATVDGFTIYRADIDGDGEEKIYCISPTGKQTTVGARPFSDYYKAAVKKLER